MGGIINIWASQAHTTVKSFFPLTFRRSLYRWPQRNQISYRLITVPPLNHLSPASPALSSNHRVQFLRNLLFILCSSQGELPPQATPPQATPTGRSIGQARSPCRGVGTVSVVQNARWLHLPCVCAWDPSRLRLEGCLQGSTDAHPSPASPGNGMKISCWVLVQLQTESYYSYHNSPKCCRAGAEGQQHFQKYAQSRPLTLARSRLLQPRNNDKTTKRC